MERLDFTERLQTIWLALIAGNGFPLSNSIKLNKLLSNLPFLEAPPVASTLLR
ncbi:hypothetical protein PALB_3080 [Pseudoalteromonas luteoviolacea B = ATCC 29581]|nr:hypothetical protein PALB_3080 [Pseudoalteromonas luteoviolacea B = ATCC 29581]